MVHPHQSKDGTQLPVIQSTDSMKGQITDIGCGLGPLCYMLSMISKERQILGIDYDEDKIAIAQHGWLRSENLRFEHADASVYESPESDVFILNDYCIT
mgnify:CR=1 FL=1